MSNYGLPRCIICDIDGTLAKRVTDRSPFDWHRVGEDAVNRPVAELLRAMAVKCPTIILLSGRDEVCRPETEKWLQDNEVFFSAPYMREKDDNRKDVVVKRELYDKYIRGQYEVLFVLDDRQQVVDMWRKDLELTCLQVDYGDF